MGARVMSAASRPSRSHPDFRLGRRILLLSLVTAGSTARAAEPPIQWDAPAACSDARQVMAVVAELLARDPVVIPPDRHIRGVVERMGPGWQLTLTLFDGTHQRSRVVAAPSCSELARAAGVALALALDPEVPAPEPASNSSAARDDGPRDSGLAAPGPEPMPVETPAAEPIQLEWRLEAAALFDGVALGAPAPGLGVSFGARRGALSGFVHGAWLPAHREAVNGGGTAQFSLLAGGVRACYELARGLLEVDACGGVELGRLAASGERLDDAASFADWWLAPSLGVTLGSVVAGPLYFRAGADALVPVLREAYRVNDSVLVHRPPSIGVRGGIALGLVLGGGG
jgi:hypothetical protein